MTAAPVIAEKRGVRVRRFTAGDLDAVARLSERLEAGGSAHRVWPERPDDARRTSGSGPIHERLFVAADGDEIRAGMWLKEQDFWAGGQTLRAGWAKYPVSESLIDRSFAAVPASLVFQLLREQPRLMALGLGGHDGPFARLLAQARWTGSTVPFFFRLFRPARVLRRLPQLRRNRGRRMAADVAAFSGAGWLATQLLGGANAVMRPRAPRGYRAEIVGRFGDWADALWLRCRDRYGFLAVRDSRTLNEVYSNRHRGVTRVRVTREGSSETAGWVVLHRMDERTHFATAPFGKLDIGLFADCLALPEDASGVCAAAAGVLADLEVDLAFANLSHPVWGNALRACGFWPAPSNFAFYRAPLVERLLAAPGVVERGIHLARGDCDGLLM